MPPDALGRLSPSRAALLGRIGGLTTALRHDHQQMTQRARSAFLARFEREVDPEGVLPESERQRRAEIARRLHFARLAARSAEMRRRKRAMRTSPGQAGASDRRAVAHTRTPLGARNSERREKEERLP